MSTAGFSRERLQRMHEVMAGYVARGDVPGIVTLVSRRGEMPVDASDMQAVGGSNPMRRDTIFRIASLAKFLDRGLSDDRRLRRRMAIDAAACCNMSSGILGPGHHRECRGWPLEWKSGAV